jgi:hypothetical protein
MMASLLRRWPAGITVAALSSAFLGTLIYALLQSAKPFYYDAGQYWLLGATFVKNGDFSLLNFTGAVRGYSLPLLFHEFQAFAVSHPWSPSALVKLFNSLIFALIGTVLAPRLAEIVWPNQRWGLAQRLTLAVLLLVFWSGYLAFPLSDFPALALAMLALIAVARPESPAWMLTAGVAGALTINVRAAYLPLGPALVVFIAWGWMQRRRSSEPRADRSRSGPGQVSSARLALYAGLFVIGFTAVSLPQSLSAHRYGNTWTFVPGYSANLSSYYLEPGLSVQRYDTYVGPDHRAHMNYADAAGSRLLRAEKNGHITSTGQYLRLIASHPLAMGEIFLKHIVNGLDPRYSTPYVDHLEPPSHRLLRWLSFLFVFLALVRVLWPAARRHLGPARWRYYVALLLCCMTSLTGQMETRYLLPAYLIVYVMALTPGWPNPIGPAEAGLRRFRTLAVLAIAGLAFAFVMWDVTTGASSQLRFN